MLKSTSAILCGLTLSCGVDQTGANLFGSSSGAADDAGNVGVAPIATTDAAADASTTDAATEASVPEAATIAPPPGVVGPSTLYRRVFITRDTFDGKMGGFAGADQACQDRAIANGLGGQWMAWLSSDDTSPPAVRFIQSAVAYVSMDGTTVANGWSDLTTNGLQWFTPRDERGVSLYNTGVVDNGVWTGTDGTGHSVADLTCGGFASNQTQVSGVRGLFEGGGDQPGVWTESQLGDGGAQLVSCAASFHLYCFEN